MSYKEQKLLAWDHLVAPHVFVGVRVVHIFSFLCCVVFLFVCLRPVSRYPMLPVSLDCLFLIAPSVFTYIYLQCNDIAVIYISNMISPEGTPDIKYRPRF